MRASDPVVAGLVVGDAAHGIAAHLDDGSPVGLPLRVGQDALLRKATTSSSIGMPRRSGLRRSSRSERRASAAAKEAVSTWASMQWSLVGRTNPQVCSARLRTSAASIDARCSTPSRRSPRRVSRCDSGDAHRAVWRRGGHEAGEVRADHAARQCCHRVPGSAMRWTRCDLTDGDVDLLPPSHVS